MATGRAKAPAVLGDGQIIGLWQGGMPPADVADAMGVSKKTVQSWITKWQKEVSLTTRPRSGRPRLAGKITDAPHVTSIMLDGPAVVEMLKPGGSRTFQEYSTVVFIPYIESQLEYRSRLDLVWDCYLKSGSLKATVRCNRGKGIRRSVTASGPLPSNLQNFLRNSDNKEKLFSFLSEQVMQLVVKDKKQVLTVPPRKDTVNLAPCNHEEADTRMMVHAADALECGHRRILICTVDTNAVILAVAVANERSEVLDDLWLTFGIGKNRLHSKKAAWATWNAFPEVTPAFVSLASTPSELPDGVLSTLERFIVLLYDRTSTCCDVNVLRKKLFSRKSRSLEHLPPTRAALEQHIKRAAYQAGHIWGQAAIAFVSLPSPSDWGWTKSGEELEPLWTTLSEVSKSCHELISCGCRKHCGGKCRCKKAALKCTGLCACEGDC
ncbi:putative winged helix-turn-helix domain containing protein 5 [Homarus americanus]|uniref:Putative winged helix-turn-helix domain containing protein 5 n=1 Tax=Homarus americanus TaxID=6706 RepID=A0A8J5K398_HOMAM|nr:putative winged helix-turn-helix domain containing protein 5 [Homarus americanus]